MREETFVTENDAALSNYIDTVSGKPLSKMKEESYFFRQSRYQAQLVKHIEDHPEFIMVRVPRLYLVLLATYLSPLTSSEWSLFALSVSLGLTSYLLPPTSHLPPPTSHLPPPTSHLPPDTYHLPPPTSHLLLITLHL